MSGELDPQLAALRLMENAWKEVHGGAMTSEEFDRLAKIDARDNSNPDQLRAFLTAFAYLGADLVGLLAAQMDQPGEAVFEFLRQKIILSQEDHDASD